MKRARVGVVSGVWQEWDDSNVLDSETVSDPDTIVMFAYNIQTDVEDAERSLRRLGVEFSPREDQIKLIHVWLGTEPEGTVLYVCDQVGNTEDGTILDKLSIKYATLVQLIKRG